MRTRREVSAGGVVVRRTTGGSEVLLGARRTRSGELVWGLPKGLVEAGETAEAAAIREVREETGWTAHITEDLGEIDYWYVWEGVRVHKVVRFFLMEAIAGDEALRDREMEAVAWYPLPEGLATAGFRSEREVLERAVRLL